MKADVAEIKRVFFAAMVQGYATGGQKSIFPDGSRGYVHEEGEWQVVDQYRVNEGTKFSFGQTTISFRGQPVWIMQYWGWYEKDAIPFLKEALAENYRQGIFTGGRGPDAFIQEVDGKELTYANDLEEGGDFGGFCGGEEIRITRGQKVLGSHGYQGGLLFDPNDPD